MPKPQKSHGISSAILLGLWQSQAPHSLSEGRMSVTGACRGSWELQERLSACSDTPKLRSRMAPSTKGQRGWGLPQHLTCLRTCSAAA